MDESKKFEKEQILVSACLLGLKCRYDGEDALNSELICKDREDFIPVCPEQLGGLSTPREPCEIAGGSGEDVLAGRGKVIGRISGTDFTAQFLRGAEQTLILAKIFGCRKAIFKSLSPSCGKGEIRVKGEIVSGSGVTSALLESRGIEVTVI